MAQNKKLFSDLFQNTLLSSRLTDPKERKIVEDTLEHVLWLHGLKPQNPLAPADIAYFLSDFRYGSLYYLCGLLSRQEIDEIDDFFDPALEKRFDKNILRSLLELQEVFDAKSIQLNAEEADIIGIEMAEGNYFDMEKETLESQVPYDETMANPLTDYIKMANYQLILNYFSKIDAFEHFVEASVLLNDVMGAAALSVMNDLQDKVSKLNNPQMAKRVRAMCKLFESVASSEESYDAMSSEMIQTMLKDVDHHMRAGIVLVTKGDEAKKTKYLRLLDLLTKPKEDIDFLDQKKRQTQDEKDREDFIQKIWGKEPPSKQTLNEIDFAVAEEILQTMAANIGKTPEEIEPDDVLIYLTDTNAANLYYTCGFLSDHEYKIFYRVMTDLEEAYDSGIEKRRLKDFKLPELLDKMCEMNPSVTSNDKRRIRACYDNFCHVVEYFKLACEVKLLAQGITDGENDTYSLTNPKGIYAASQSFGDNDFVRLYHIAHMLNAKDCASHAEAFHKPRLLVTYLSDYYFHDALKKMRAEGQACEELGTQTAVRVMNDYLYGITEKCTLSPARVAHTSALLVLQMRKVLGMNAKNADVQSVLSRFDGVMGEKTIKQVVENSWKRLGVLNPGLASSYQKGR